MKVDWMDFTIDIVANEIGPVSIIVIEQALAKVPAKQNKMSSSRDYLVFLKQLKRELPEDIDGKQLCDKLWVEMMNQKTIF